MLVIRFTRTGKKKQAYFRIVVQEKHKSPSAKFLDILGNYDPHTKKLTIDSEKVIEYMSKGAQPSNSLAKLLKKEGVKLPAWVKIQDRNRAPKSKGDEETTKVAPVAEPKDEKTEEPKSEDDKSQKENTEPKNEQSENDAKSSAPEGGAVEEKSDTIVEDKKDDKEVEAPEAKEDKPDESIKEQKNGKTDEDVVVSEPKDKEAEVSEAPKEDKK